MKQQFKYDPLLFKSKKGAVTKGENVTFFVQTESPASCIWLMVKGDGDMPYEENLMKKTKNGFKVTKKFEKSGHYWYFFKIITEDGTLYLCKDYLNNSYVSPNKGDDFFVLVVEEEYNFDGALAGKVIYQIMVDRFAKVGEIEVREPLKFRDDWGGGIKKNTNDPIEINLEVFGGNINGVISKLDYLKDLGVGVLYLNPINMANSNHKYDTADYMTIDPMFGTETEFKLLIQEAKKRDIIIIIDGVYNHTGSDSRYFNKCRRFGSLGAYNSKKSKYFSWYSFDEYPDKYLSWWGIDTLPSIRHNSQEFQNYIAGDDGVIEKFMKFGVGGIRLDVVDEITDEFTKKISDKVKKYSKNAVIMGEVWEDASTKISYGSRRKYFSENELNSVMNYPVKESLLTFIKTKNPIDFVSTIRMLENNYPGAVVHNLMNFLGTHDTGRIYSELLDVAEKNEEHAKKLFKIAFTILFTTIGSPSIFYGDEYGMKNNDGSSRGCFDWNNDGKDILQFVKKLSEIRQREVFRFGDMNILDYANGKLVFERISNNHSKQKERIITMVNLRESALCIEFEGKFKSLISGETVNVKRLEYLDFDIIEEIKE